MVNELKDLLALVGDSLSSDGATVTVTDAAGFRANVGKLVQVSALESGARQGLARFLIRAAALELGVFPASIHELYLARGRGDAPMVWATPAFNLRALSHHAARAMFRAAKKIDAGAFIFELARSEMGYTAQRPVEYSTNILAAAVAEGFTGPVFIQGDHFQVSAKKYASEGQAEVNAVKDLAREAISAGFYNIDIDTSTLVDITKTTVPEQQKVNIELSANFGAFIREIEPQGLIVSIGGEIGEVGGHNSNEEELRTFMDGYVAEFKRLAPGKPGLSKISIQTGTSHGGTVLPDGSIAQVNLDFDTLRNLSRIARKDYALGGTVQHGASTLPEDMFHKFVENEAIEVHLATNFMNKWFDTIPDDFRKEIYAWLDENAASERKPGMTDQQFYYKARKNAIGPFKAKSYELPEEAIASLTAAWEAQFDKLFNLLGLKDSCQHVEKFVSPVKIAPDIKFYLGEDVAEELADDLSD